MRLSWRSYAGLPAALVAALLSTGTTTSAHAPEVDVRQVSLTNAAKPLELDAYQVVMSGDGRHVAFTSAARNLPGGTPDLDQHVYVRDLRTGRTEHISVPSRGRSANGDGGSDPSISANGRFVTFSSTATNLDAAAVGDGFVDVYVRDRLLQRTTQVSVNDAGDGGDQNSFLGRISDNGKVVVFQSHATNLVTDDTNSKRDVFVRNLGAGTTSRVSVSSREHEGKGTARGNDISENGRFVVFGTTSRLVPHERAGLFVRDRRRGLTRTVCEGRDGRNPRADFPSLSADGHHVTFNSFDDNLVRGDRNAASDIFVCNLDSGRIRRVSVTSTGRETGGATGSGSLSADGRFVVFAAQTRLVREDRDSHTDIYLRDVRRGTNILVSVGSDGRQVTEPAGGSSDQGHAISGNGRFVAWEASGRRWTPTDTNRANDVFWRDLRP